MVRENSSIKRGTFRTRDILKSFGFPYSDEIELKPSNREFKGGGQYGVEIPATNSLEMLEMVITGINKYGITCTRVNETIGSYFLTESEIKEMLACARENGLGLTLSLGPRPEYDIKAAFYRTNFGLEQARRLNNNDAISASVDDALRLIDLGCRGIVVYDPGILMILNKLRLEGIIPDDVIFILSSHAMTTNPMIAQQYYEAGANSAVIIHDATLPVLQEMRRLAGDMVFDIPTDCYISKGGFIRFTELAEIIQVASPVMLKMGLSSQGHPYDPVNEAMINRRIKRIAAGLEYLERADADLTYIGEESVDRCLAQIG